jgi:cellulose biosynthesis protein BcsQ
MGFFTEKGGTGKSTLCHTVASYLRNLANETALPDEKDRFRILAIDADPQNNLSVFNTPPAILAGFSDPGPEEKKFPNTGPNGHYRMTLIDLLSGEFWPGRFHRNGTDRYDIILGKEVPHGIERNLLGQLEPEAKQNADVREVVGRVASLAERYDAILIDFNPTYSAVNRLLLTCCDVVFNVVTMDLMCIQTFPKFKKNFGEICRLRARLGERVPFLAAKKTLRCFVVPNMVRLQARGRPIQAHALCIDRMIRAINEIRHHRFEGFSLEMSDDYIPRCEALGNFIHDIPSVNALPGNQAAMAFRGFVRSVENLITHTVQLVHVSALAGSVPSTPSDDQAQTWTWIARDPRNCPPRAPVGRQYLYCVDLPDCYKIGKTAKFTDRQRTLQQMASNRLPANQRAPVQAAVVFLYESDTASVVAVEDLLHRYLRHTSADFREYYYKNHPLTGQPNEDLLEVVRLIDEAQDGDVNDFCLELACNELKIGRAKVSQKKKKKPAQSSALRLGMPPPPPPPPSNSSAMT